MKDDNHIKVLFLPAWYPHQHDSMFGLFVQQHAKALTPHAEVVVLNCVQVPKQKEKLVVKTHVENNLTEIIIYHKASRLPFSIFKRVHNIKRYFYAQKAGWEIIKASDLVPDICHVHILTRAGFLAYFLKRRKNIPYLITEHWSRYFSFNNQFNNPIHKRITQFIVKHADAMTSVSEVLKRAMQDKGIEHSNWSILPNVIDIKRFIPVDKKANPEKTKLFHISCFEDKSKNISGLLRAYSKSIPKRKDLELVMIGDGPDWEAMKAYSKELQISDSQISFTGVLESDALIHQMQECDFSVLFSHYETFGIVVLESLALGKPVVASKAGAVPEILPEKFGSLVDIGDEDAMAEEILKMADAYSSYDVDDMHSYVADQYDSKVVGFQMKKLYQQNLSK